MNVVSAAIPGTDPNAGELILVAHAFETIATPGANDNCTGVATILEVGRALARLIRDGDLPQPAPHDPLRLGAGDLGHDRRTCTSTRSCRTSCSSP